MMITETVDLHNMRENLNLLNCVLDPNQSLIKQIQQRVVINTVSRVFQLATPASELVKVSMSNHNCDVTINLIMSSVFFSMIFSYY